MLSILLLSIVQVARLFPLEFIPNGIQGLNEALVEYRSMGGGGCQPPPPVPSVNLNIYRFLVVYLYGKLIHRSSFDAMLGLILSEIGRDLCSVVFTFRCDFCGVVSLVCLPLPGMGFTLGHLVDFV